MGVITNVKTADTGDLVEEYALVQSIVNANQGEADRWLAKHPNIAAQPGAFGDRGENWIELRDRTYQEKVRKQARLVTYAGELKAELNARGLGVAYTD